ncbi:MAG: DNA-binding protein [Prevotella sp.]|nr:DNA-binding protein [Bacteroidaceae bacterium]MBR1415183.1 DNA-binding protein [Prevotella sp.]
MKRTTILVIALYIALSAQSQDTTRPWTFWYWMYGAVSEQGIKADLQAMKDVGLGGCYLMPIRGAAERPEYGGKADALSNNFWRMVDCALSQADSLGLELGIHVCDGFALAGGPWIKPEESMQKVVFCDTVVGGGKHHFQMSKPQHYQDYYEDIAVYAIPISQQPLPNTYHLTCSPEVTINDKGVYCADKPCWIQYGMEHPTLIRNVEIEPSGTNIQCQRLNVKASNDGIHFIPVKQLTPPRQGWQNTGYNTTFSIPPTRAKYFRFEWTPEGSEPGAEDLDAAKWKAVLRLKSIKLGTFALIDNWEGKAGYVWRIAPDTPEEDLGVSDFLQPQDLIMAQMQDDEVSMTLPQGQWRILRMGHTSTGHTNATAGGAKGLECDKFSRQTVANQVDEWFGRFMQRPHHQVVRYMHVDSWECGSQNWSRNFADEFKKRRGYDLLPFLPVYAGIPMANGEQVLHDIRLTINDLINDIFFKTVKQRANAYGVCLSSESVAPTMVSDGMEHYKYVDLPMGEYWLNSPTHDKPNDMLDAISGAHVYGKPIVQAEGFTEVRGVWDETPASIKPLLDRNFCLGMNRLFFHVNTHNPWLDRKPGMTLDGIGLFFQRDQTWFPEAKGLVDYITRCQRYLQRGRPVIDIAVYTGDEMPRRAFTPDRLVPMLPGLFGPQRVASEQKRLANEGQPMEESPVGVRHSAGILDLKDWTNPLHGYKYDSMNPDGLAHWLSEMQSPTSWDIPYYRVLVVPQGIKVSPEAQAKIDSLKPFGITVITEPYKESTLPGLPPDVVLPEGIAYAHRKGNSTHYFFLSNQTDSVRHFRAKFRIKNRMTWMEDALRGTPLAFHEEREGDYSCVDITLQKHGSVFLMSGFMMYDTWLVPQDIQETKPLGEKLTWDVTFRENGEHVKTKQLFDWSQSDNDRIRYFSGHARYTTTFTMKKQDMKHTTWWLRLPGLKDVAHVWLNGVDLGIAWTDPYQLELGKHLHKGKNLLEIEVVNTWHNALRGADEGKAPYDGIWTNAKYRTKGNDLLPAGLLQTPLLVKQRHGALRAFFDE